MMAVMRSSLFFAYGTVWMPDGCCTLPLPHSQPSKTGLTAHGSSMIAVGADADTESAHTAGQSNYWPTRKINLHRLSKTDSTEDPALLGTTSETPHSAWSAPLRAMSTQCGARRPTGQPRGGPRTGTLKRRRIWSTGAVIGPAKAT